MLESLSIVIPVFNEADRITPTLEDIFSKVGKFSKKYEVIIVDDGSTDDMVVRVRQRFALLYQNGELNILSGLHQGKGGAVKKGMLIAQNDWVLFMDADNSADISSLKYFLPFLEEYQIIIGSRALVEDGIIKKDWWYRIIVGKIFNFLVRTLVDIPFKDTQCGFKLLSQKVARELFANVQECGFAFDVEILYLAFLSGFKVKEVGVDWRRSSRSSVRLFRDGIKMFFIIFKIAFRRVGFLK